MANSVYRKACEVGFVPDRWAELTLEGKVDAIMKLYDMLMDGSNEPVDREAEKKIIELVQYIEVFYKIFFEH